MLYIQLPILRQSIYKFPKEEHALHSTAYFEAKHIQENLSHDFTEGETQTLWAMESEAKAHSLG